MLQKYNALFYLVTHPTSQQYSSASVLGDLVEEIEIVDMITWEEMRTIRVVANAEVDKRAPIRHNYELYVG